ncbi:MAG: winged helix-turn-helix transcriptional regulator [Myxococcales bacterium]|nr:winged helix-turn-helix transcriptional regulator [Myxococcales bacterium]
MTTTGTEASGTEIDLSTVTFVDDAERAAGVADVLKSLAHPLRIRIVAVLGQGPQHVNALAERLDAKQSIISQQLRILRMRKLVRRTPVNGFAIYELAEPRLLTLIHCMENCTVV